MANPVAVALGRRIAALVSRDKTSKVNIVGIDVKQQ